MGKKVEEKVTKKAAKEEVKSTSTASTDFVLKPKKATSAWIYFNTETVAKLKEKEGLEQKVAF